MPKDDPTPEKVISDALRNVEILTKNVAAIVTYRRALYLEYVSQGFTEAQALELIKGAY